MGSDVVTALALLTMLGKPVTDDAVLEESSPASSIGLVQQSATERAGLEAR
jgi:hypothetical protein